MKRPAAGLYLGLLTAALLITGDRAGGYTWFQVGGLDVVWIGAESVRDLSPSTFPPGSEPDVNVLTAMGLWNVVPACDFLYFYNRLDQDYPVDHQDGFNDTVAVSASELDPGVLGVTFLVNSGANWFDMDMFLSDAPDGIGWTFEPNPPCDVVAAPTTYGYSFVLVVTHELGHALGLGHDPQGTESPSSTWFLGTMNPRYPSGGTLGQEAVVELHADDRLGARYLYPHSGPSGPPYRDLASPAFTPGPVVGRVVPLSFTPAVVDPGEMITAKAVLENLGTTNEFFVRQGFFLSSDDVITTVDESLGELLWDLPAGEVLQYEVEIDLPVDLAAGEWHLGSIIDDLDEVDEEWEDNNAVAYCAPLTVRRLAPAFSPFVQQDAVCGQPFTGPTPQVALPLNMAPITWSLDNPEPGMTIDPATGVVSWPSPVADPFLYTIHVRATNPTGSSTQTLFIGVDPAQPQFNAIGNAAVSCLSPYTGPVPTLTQPACMQPIINWSLDAAPPGMTINNNTGVVSWPSPRPLAVPYTITVRATNAAGNGTVSWQLLVSGTSDLDGSGRTDWSDFDVVQTCVGGPGAVVSAACRCADLDGDADIDLADFALFMLDFDGAGLHAGACCAGNGTCSVQPAGACITGGGTYLGDDTTCVPGACSGACCFPGGCLDLAGGQCGIAGGTFQGAGTACATTSCVATPTGACCHANEACTFGTAAACSGAGGTYQGDNTTCGGVDCTIPPTGACCHANESCTEGAESTCVTAGGTYQGDDTTCATSDCTVAATGACCNPANWGCAVMTEVACFAAGGTYEGDDRTCAATTCPEYRNDAVNITDYYDPGTNSALGDDLTLSGSHRRLVYYDIAVYGGGSGAFNVTVALYTGCPGAGGTLIPGTSSTFTSVPDDDDVYVLSADLAGAPVTLPNSVWMVATFNRPDAGWVLAGPAERGSTANLFGQNDPPWGCNFGLSGLYSGFWASLQCIPAGGRSADAAPLEAGEIITTITPLGRTGGALSRPGMREE